MYSSKSRWRLSQLHLPRSNVGFSTFANSARSVHSWVRGRQVRRGKGPVDMHPHPWPPADLLQLFDGWVAEISVVAFSAVLKTSHLEPDGCEPGLAGLFLCFLFLFLSVLRLHHGGEIILRVCESLPWLLEMRDRWW